MRTTPDIETSIDALAAMQKLVNAWIEDDAVTVRSIMLSEDRTLDDVINSVVTTRMHGCVSIPVFSHIVMMVASDLERDEWRRYYTPIDTSPNGRDGYYPEIALQALHAYESMLTAHYWVEYVERT